MPPYNIPFLFDYVFANIVLPNAINPELAVINYFHIVAVQTDLRMYLT